MNPPPVENSPPPNPAAENPSKTESLTDAFLEFFKTMCDGVLARQKLQNACAEYTLNADNLKFLYLRKIILLSRLNFLLLVGIIIVLLFLPFSFPRPPEHDVQLPVSEPEMRPHETYPAPPARNVA
jgi:hypothetical protein